MDPNNVVNHKLKTCQPNTRVRVLAILESTGRVGKVEHDLNRDIGKVFHILHLSLVLEISSVYHTRVPFSTNHCNLIVVFQFLGCVGGSNDRRNPKLTSDNSSMTRAAPTVGHDGSGLLHNGFPVWVGHIGDKNLSLLEVRHLINIRQNSNLSRSDLISNCASLRQLSAPLQKLELLLDTCFLARGHRLGSGLDDVELASISVFGPLDIDRKAVMLFNLDCHLSEVAHLFVGDRPATALSLISLDDFTATLLGVHHLDLLGAQCASDHGIFILFKCRLEDVELVGVDRAANDSFTKTPC
mmetsp:Transcript_12204/g.19330  ORF Transcript_12204/g.19330 Transcript_12204/m.19330 type:complete len:299 (+) Transcript_12204:971-1867(+)